jgi:hypothetical protein
MIVKSNYAYGMYRVGETDYLNKSDALFHASKTKQNVSWDFHESAFSTQNWQLRPPGNLNDMYKERAQQIRDTYDYIIVHFSGGADSWTVLNSFLSNGIHVDEIYTRWARKEEQYKTVNNIVKDEVNLVSEFEYAVKPVLDHISKNYPNIKIYVDDYSDEYEKDLTEQKFLNGGHYISMGTFHRFSRKSPWEQQAIKENKSVGVVYGFDKIQCHVEGNKFYAYFVDRFGGTDIDPERDVEAFYWTPKNPLIPILQAHILKDYYSVNVINHIAKLQKNPDSGRETYISLCYPLYDLSTFQSGKQYGSAIWSSEMWIAKHNPRYYNSWKWTISQYTKSIDNRFCTFYQNTTLKTGYQPFQSKKYLVGEFPHNITFTLGH